ncbi:RNA-binding protein [Mucilaginibacter sp. HC2]|uniref:RNA recognition motif domain-containing protein n=1 Tax=Mucilaginibacter inviolabilis TaxID=2714892 RepID=UPI00140CE172|nr:RNA-binding protein [Mucilaginibacter inviolabilis]NHA03396.1 RNA-binding protein [Mucilaginibacter inviolabilis]
MIKLFVSGFPLEMKELELVQLFGPFGTVSTVKIVRDKVTRKCKGYAFLEMENLGDAERAVSALNGMPSGDRYLTINITLVEKGNPGSDNNRSLPPATRYIKVERPGIVQKKKRPRKQF